MNNQKNQRKVIYIKREIFTTITKKNYFSTLPEYINEKNEIA